MANGLLRRESSCIWISSLRFGRRVMILLSMRLRFANKRGLSRLGDWGVDYVMITALFGVVCEKEMGNGIVRLLAYD